MNITKSVCSISFLFVLSASCWGMTIDEVPKLGATGKSLFNPYQFPSYFFYSCAASFKLTPSMLLENRQNLIEEKNLLLSVEEKSKKDALFMWNYMEATLYAENNLLNKPISQWTLDHIQRINEILTYEQPTEALVDEALWKKLALDKELGQSVFLNQGKLYPKPGALRFCSMLIPYEKDNRWLDVCIEDKKEQESFLKSVSDNLRKKNLSRAEINDHVCLKYFLLKMSPQGFAGLKKMFFIPRTDTYEILKTKNIRMNFLAIKNETIKQMSNLLESIIKMHHANEHPIRIAAFLLHEFHHISPFFKGNKRTAHIVLNAILRQAGYLPTPLPMSFYKDYFHAGIMYKKPLEFFLQFLSQSITHTHYFYTKALHTVCTEDKNKYSHCLCDFCFNPSFQEKIEDHLLMMCHGCYKTLMEISTFASENKENEKRSLFLCGGCKSIKYCSLECQKEDRLSHAYRCNLIQQNKKYIEFLVPGAIASTPTPSGKNSGAAQPVEAFNKSENVASLILHYLGGW